MAKLYLDELEAALSCQGVSNLVQDMEDSKKTNSCLTNFVSNSTSTLEGETWDAVRNKIGEFSEALEARCSAASALHDAITQALNMLKDYMGEDQMLDSSKLGDCRAQKQECENTISSLKAKLSSSTENTSSIRSQISSAEKTLEELDRLIKKLEGLDAIYQQAQGVLESGYQEVISFSSKASIKSSKKYVYSK